MALSKPQTAVRSVDHSEKETICGACKADGDTRPAVKYCLDCNQPICQTCVDSHRRIKQISVHKLVDHTKEDAVNVGQFLSRCLACPNHPDKNVELICKNHDIMCCITCATVGHRDCRQVLEVATQAAGANMSINTQHFIKHLDAAKKHMEEIVKQHQKNNQDLQSQISCTIPKQVQEMKANVTEALDKLSKLVLSESKELGMQEVNECEAEINKWCSHIKDVEDACKLLTTVRQNGSDIHVYVAVNNAKKTLAEIDRHISSLGQHLTNSSVLFEDGQILQNAYVLVNNVKKSLAENGGPIYNQVGEDNFEMSYGNIKNRQILSPSQRGNAFTSYNMQRAFQQHVGGHVYNELEEGCDFEVSRPRAFANVSVETRSYQLPQYKHSQYYNEDKWGNLEEVYSEDFDESEVGTVTNRSRENYKYI